MALRFTLLAFLFCCSVSHAEEVETPLNQIWAHRMPGTRKISELESAPTSETSLMGRIGQQHSIRAGKKIAGPAFAVEGTGSEALKKAHEVLVERKQTPSVMSQKRDLSIVFFTLVGGYYVHLAKVEQTKNSIQVLYEFIPHQTHDLTQHFALIPLGKLSPGKYKVNIVAKPFAKKFLDAGFKEIPDERKLPRISSSFEFVVE